MKKILCMLLCSVLLMTACAVSASAYTGYYCGGSAENFSPVGDVEITWDADATTKLDLSDGDLSDWVAAGYSAVAITPENMVSWVGGSEENPAGGVPEGWGIDAYFVADSDYLYFGFNVTDPDVVLVQDATNYTEGDSFCMPIDFDRALGKILGSDPEFFPSVSCICYSFGPMGKTAVPIQIMRQNSDGNDGVIFEANGDGVKGSTALTETGWCAEFAFSWHQLYEDFKYKAYADDWEIVVYEGDPLEVGCALCYLNNVTDAGLSWAAGTLKTNDVSRTFYDHGMRLLLEYSHDLTFNCKDIIVYTCGVNTPEPETMPPTEPVTEAPTEEPTNTSTSAPTDVPTEAPIGSGETSATGGGCSGMLISAAGMIALMIAGGAVWLIKKKD